MMAMSMSTFGLQTTSTRNKENRCKPPKPVIAMIAAKPRHSDSRFLEEESQQESTF